MVLVLLKPHAARGKLRQGAAEGLGSSHRGNLFEIGFGPVHLTSQMLL